MQADRTCIAVLDACKFYPTAHFQYAIEQESARNCRLFYTTGFFIASNYEVVKLMMKHASDNNYIFGFNFASEGLYAESKEEILNILTYSDFIMCNIHEALPCAQDFGVELGLINGDDDKS